MANRNLCATIAPPRRHTLYERNDYGWVHNNSGILNYASHNIMTAKSGGKYLFAWRELAAIFYISLPVHLPRTLQFADSLHAVVQASRSLFRGASAAVLATKIKAIEGGFAPGRYCLNRLKWLHPKCSLHRALRPIVSGVLRRNTPARCVSVSKMADLPVLWWNVQRLLAPRSSSLARALDATPEMGWTPAAYKKKLTNLGAVLRYTSPNRSPALLGLCEVENDKVARDLQKQTGWKDLRLVEDPDARLAGNDLVLFYDPALLRQVGVARSYNVHNRYTTRDLLEVDFQTTAGNPLTVITAHWPSRRMSNSEPLRIGLADYTMRLIERQLKFGKDELLDRQGRPAMPSAKALKERWNRPLIVIGDFNDAPYDTSVAQVLGARRTPAGVTEERSLPTGQGMSAVDSYLNRSVRLYNPAFPLLTASEGPTGTHYWDGDWYMLDQALVSRGLLGNGPLSYVQGSMTLHAPRSIPMSDGTLEVTTRAGVPRAFDPAKQDGVSDHLALSLMLNEA